MAFANPAYGLPAGTTRGPAPAQSAQIQALQAQLAQTPEYQRYLSLIAQPTGRNVVAMQQAKQATLTKARQLGLPDDYWLNPNGDIIEKGWFDKHPVLAAALGAAGGVGLLALPAAGAVGAMTSSTAVPATASTLASTSTIGIAPTIAGGAASGAVPAALAGSSAPAWLSSGAWQGAALNTGLNAVGTILDNRGRQQAADTLAGASERAGQNSLEATRLSIDAANQARSVAAPYLQNPGYYQQGSTMPTPQAQMPSFAQMGGGRVGTQPLPRNTAQSPQGFTDSYLSGLPLSQLQSDASNPSTPDYAQSVQGEIQRRQQGGSGQAAPTGAYLQQLLSSGMNPQEAVARFNSETGRTTGNEAVLYGAEVHGRPTIGLPGSYLSLEGNGWQETQRTPEAPNGNLRGGGMPSFAQMGGSFSGGAPMPQLQPAPGAYQPVSFANLLTVQRPQYLMPQFMYPSPGQR